MSLPQDRIKAIVAGIVAVAVAAATAVLLFGDSGDQGGDPASSLEVVDSREIGPRLLDYTIRTASVPGNVGVRVLLPVGYEGSDRSFPVLYLLHGAGGDRRFWSDTAEVASLTGDLPLIVVMPDGGGLGFYSDWQRGPARPQWETFHVDELIPWVDSEFRTIGSREGRAVAGASMGGLGALMYAGRHPDTFAAAASFSAPAEVRPETMAKLFEAVGRSPAVTERIWGESDADVSNWLEHDPVALARDFDETDVILHVGNGRPEHYTGPLRDPIETLLRKTNVRLHQRLSGLGIEHVWDPDVGAHNLTEFRQGLARSLPRLLDSLQAEGA